MEPSTGNQVIPFSTIGPWHSLQQGGHEALADALRALLGALIPTSGPAPSEPPRAIESNDSDILPGFKPFRPPPLDKGSWLERARRAAIAHAELRSEAPTAARHWLAERCGLQFDEAQVDRATLSLDSQLRSWRRKRIHRCFWVHIHVWHERVGVSAGTEPWPVVVAVGLDHQGYRSVLDVTWGGSGGEFPWEEFWKSLQARGLCELRGITARAIPGLFKSAKSVWPDAIQQICHNHFSERARRIVPAKAVPTAKASLKQWETPVDVLIKQWTDALEGRSKLLRNWAAHPNSNEPSAFAVTRLPLDLRAPLSTVSWLERELRKCRTAALVDDLPPSPHCKSRLIAAAIIEWESRLDGLHPFIEPESILEATSSGSSNGY